MPCTASHMQTPSPAHCRASHITSAPIAGRSRPQPRSTRRSSRADADLTTIAAMIADAPATRAPTPVGGLSAAEVAERRDRGETNASSERTSRSVAKILRHNLLTRFNFILGTLLVVILIVGQPQDAVFGIILIANAVIGIAQELRAKVTLDRLAVLSAPRV